MKNTITIDAPLRHRLIALADRYETANFIDGDPSWWMHQVHGVHNQEAMAFVAQALSYGSRSQFMPRIGQLLNMADGEMDEWLRSRAYCDNFSQGDDRCFYRLYSHGMMRAFFDAYSLLLTEYGSLGKYVINHADGDGLRAVASICDWFSSHGAAGVVPRNTTSACKRVCMFLRWMVRSGSPVDLGLWADDIDRRTLIMPMDTHVVSEAMRLGLLHTRTASMSTAQQLTCVMAQVFPDDPLRGDFALFGLGVDAQRDS